MKITKNSGFSLIELIIVIALLAIVLAIAAPNFNAYRQNTNLREAARDISSDISYWKQRAVAENRGYQINFNSANQYTILQETVVNNVRTGNYVNLATKNVAAGNSSIVISGTPSFFPYGNTYLIFYPRGTSGDGTIVLMHNQRLSTTEIKVNKMGRVHIEYYLK